MSSGAGDEVIGKIYRGVDGVEIYRAKGKLTDRFKLDRKSMGSGSYGTVSAATDKGSGQKRACKTMAKKAMKNVARFLQEIQIMSMLTHPSIIRLYESFQDEKNIYLILELCTGGELFDKVVEQGRMQEEVTRRLMRDTLHALNYLHEHHFVHRDLKPENFLFGTDAPDAPIKMIDFGLSTMWKEGEMLSTKVGTPYYVAPQVLQGAYTNKCDVWSVGVIIFVLLAGFPPFFGDSDSEILAKIRKGKFEFPNREEDDVEFSELTKELISGMLRLNERTRWSAAQCLQHPWFTTDAAAVIQFSDKVLGNIQNFHRLQKFKKMAILAIAQHITDDDVQNLKNLFMSLDKDNNGTLTKAEIEDGVKTAKLQITQEELFRILNSMDGDRSDEIDYTEFLAATLDTSISAREGLCKQAFAVFDRDGDGKITVNELELALHSTEEVAKVKELLQTYDKNGDGVIDFNEFMAMMESN